MVLLWREKGRLRRGGGGGRREEGGGRREEGGGRREEGGGGESRCCAPCVALASQPSAHQFFHILSELQTPRPLHVHCGEQKNAVKHSGRQTLRRGRKRRIISTHG